MRFHQALSRYTRRSIVALSAAGIISALSLTACGDTVGSENNQVSLDDAVGVTVEPARITLLNQGTGEKHALRYTDTSEDDNAEQEKHVSIRDSFSQTVLNADTGVEELPNPDTEDYDFSAQLNAKSSAIEEDSGSTRLVEITMSQPEFANKETSADEKHLSSATGFQFGWYANDRGQMSSVKLAAPADATDEGRSLVEGYIMKLLSLPIIFPDDAVGEEAEWRVETRVSGQVNMLQTTTYTLRTIAGSLVHLEMKVEQRPTLGSFSFEDTTLDVLNSQTNTSPSSELTIDLSKPLPVSGNADFLTRVIYGTKENPHSTRVAQDTNTGIHFE